MNSDTLSSTSSALLVRRPDDLPSEYAVTRHGSLAVTGPGRSLHQLYQSGGRWLGNVMDRFAHNLGLGPDAVSDRIQESFGSQQERLLKLDGLFGDNNCNLRALEKDCKILMKYALPLHSPMTQLHAFKNIIMLITRYPGLRQLFLHCKHVRQAAPDVWIRVGETYDPKWLFFWRLAARCVWDHDIAPVLEKTLPRELGLICERHGVIDELLTILSCHKASDSVACVAIRYLGGILELSTFWLSRSDNRHQSVVEKLFKNAENILRDVGLDSTVLDESVEDVPFDTEGVDILADAIIGGVEIWINHVPRSRLASQYWFGKFVAFIHLLRWPNAEILVPRSWYHASTEELQSVVPVAFEYKLSELSESDAEDQRHSSPSHRKSFDVQPLAPTMTDRGAASSISHDVDITSDSTASNVSTTSLVVPSGHEVSPSSTPQPVVEQIPISPEYQPLSVDTIAQIVEWLSQTNPDLDYPVESLAAGIQSAMRALYNVQMALIENLPHSRSFTYILDDFKNVRDLFRAEWEMDTTFLQNCYNYCDEWIALCNFAVTLPPPGEGFAAARDVLMLAMNVYDEARAGRSRHERLHKDLRDHRHMLTSVFSLFGTRTEGRRPHVVAGRSNAQFFQESIRPNGQDSLMEAYAALSNIGTAIGDFLVFFKDHVNYLSRISSRRTATFPITVHELRTSADKWRHSQTLLLAGMTSISESLEAVTVVGTHVSSPNLRGGVSSGYDRQDHRRAVQQ